LAIGESQRERDRGEERRERCKPEKKERPQFERATQFDRNIKVL